MNIDFINGMCSPQMFGMQKYRVEITRRLPSINPNNIEYWSISNIPGVNQLYGLMWYPSIVKRRVNANNVKHITRQDISYVNKRNLGKTIITCHDLIPIVYYGVKYKRHPVWSKNVMGMKQADHIITTSEFSQKDIAHYLKIPTNGISVIPNAVDHSIYYPQRDKSILSKYGIKSGQKVMLYVGAEEPRKNVPFLINVLKDVKRENPDVKLLKVGASNWHGNVRRELMTRITDLGLEHDVIFTEYVDEVTLAKLYNAADVFVFPSLYEGFGLPPLEAIACGTPVVASCTSSLPEVLGNGALLGNPYEISSFSEKIGTLLNDIDARTTMVLKGLERAKEFTWEQSAAKTLEVYNKVDKF
jgi:glycosyltransferase involved in cell wall biosynthesis